MELIQIGVALPLASKQHRQQQRPANNPTPDGSFQGDVNLTGINWSYLLRNIPTNNTGTPDTEVWLENHTFS